MSKLSKKVSDRLLNLLYTTTSTEVATKVPIVTKFLYEQSDDSIKHRSVLDGLMENEWKQRPITESVDDLPKLELTRNKSNILKFRCQNSYISATDFYNIYPINRERKYLLSNELRKGIRFEVVKARNPLTLLLTGSYYLIFPNYTHACVYWLETLGKNLNGFKLNLEFVNCNSNELKYMSSPYLGDSGDEIPHHKNNKHNIGSDIGKQPVQEIFKHNLSKVSIIDQLAQLENNKSTTSLRNLDHDPNYSLLAKFASLKERHNCVLIRNLPFGLSKHALPKLLWDYDLAFSGDFSKCIKTIINDPIKQSHICLIQFANNTNAKRFVRNFHGKKWESVQSEKEKLVYEPLLCETID